MTLLSLPVPSQWTIVGPNVPWPTQLLVSSGWGLVLGHCDNGVRLRVSVIPVRQIASA